MNVILYIQYMDLQFTFSNSVVRIILTETHRHKHCLHGFMTAPAVVIAYLFSDVSLCFVTCLPTKRTALCSQLSLKDRIYFAPKINQ